MFTLFQKKIKKYTMFTLLFFFFRLRNLRVKTIIVTISLKEKTVKGKEIEALYKENDK